MLYSKYTQNIAQHGKYKSCGYVHVEESLGLDESYLNLNESVIL